MRITESRLLEITTRGVDAAKQKVGRASAELSSGMRVRRPSDDPSAWLEGMRAKARKEVSVAHGKASAAAQDRLSESELRVQEMIDIFSQARERSVMFANESYDAAARQLGAEEMLVIRDRALNALNAQGTSGEYLFAGSQSSTPPFSPQGAYQGDSSTRQVGTGAGATVAMSIPGNEFTSQFGVDVLATLDNFISALSNNDPAAIRLSMGELEAAFDQVNGIMRRIGARGASMMAADDARLDLELQLDGIYSSRTATDAVKSAVDLNEANNALEGSRAASQQIVSMTRVS